MKLIRTDCLVIGAGLAGSAYALHAARAGFRSSCCPSASRSRPTATGRRAASSTTSRRDPAKLARARHHDGGDGTANPAAIDQLVREGPAAVKELLIDELGVGFDRDAGWADSISPARADTAAPHHPRQGHHRHAILAAVAARVDATPGITRRAGWVAVDLLTLSHNTDDRATLRAADLLRLLRARHPATGEVAPSWRRKPSSRPAAWADFPAHDQPARQRRSRCGDGLSRRRAAHRPRVRAVSPDRFLQEGGPALSRHRGPARRGRRAGGCAAAPFHGRLHPLGSLAPRDVVARVHQAAPHGDRGTRAFTSISAR
jgi:L-aspartate oxidase